MEIDKMSDIISDIKSLLLELYRENRAILDISVYPDLYKMLEVNRSGFTPIYYFPDTIEKLILMAKENEQYYYYITRLLIKWTRRYIDFKILDQIFIEKEYPHAKVKLITEDTIDKDVYSFCYKNFVSKDLVIEFSPKFNLMGDLIGKILGFAKKSKTPILMRNQTLIRYVRKLIPIFEAANLFVDQKQKFFSRFIPLKETRGIKWLVGITVGVIVHPIGFVLAVIDP